MPGVVSSYRVRRNISLTVRALQSLNFGIPDALFLPTSPSVCCRPLAYCSSNFSVRPKTLLALTLSILSAIFMTMAPLHAPAIPENNSAATQLKPGVDKFAVPSLNVNPQALSPDLSSNTFLSASLSALSPAAIISISVGQEQQALVLLGFAFLLGGLVWLKKARRVGERPAVSYKPAKPPVALPEMEPEWIEVELVTESASTGACNEVQISA
jgi:hypothetical protein